MKFYKLTISINKEVQSGNQEKKFTQFDIGKGQYQTITINIYLTGY